MRGGIRRAAAAVTEQNRSLRWLLSLLPPFVALALQLLASPLTRHVWFLFFYPAVFLSSWVGGLRAALFATAISATAVLWFFVPPAYTFVKTPGFYFAIAVFCVMGVLFGVFHDRLRKANQRSREALEATQRAHDEVRRVNEHVVHLYERTKELDALKSQFFATVSHELRTPLTLILGPTEQLLEDAETSDAARRELDVVARNARTLLRHVNDLLDVAKLEAGGMKLEYAETDLARLTRFVAGHFEVLSKEKRAAFEVECPPALPAEVDPDKVQRILMNLLSNAFKFTPVGGQVSLTVHETPGRAVFVVADSGPGIAPDQREAVFERFRQLEGGSTRRFGGTGLGLSIARELALLHGGSIAIHDAPEGGAAFEVELPRAAPSGAAVAPAGGESSGRPAGARDAIEELGSDVSEIVPEAGRVDGPLVLVVEDNPDMSHFIARGLTDLYAVAVAPNGREGLDRARSLTPDLILSDVMMPEMSGDELVRAVRRCPELDATPIILLTAKADDELRLELLRHGAQDYLTKPFSVAELRARVANLVAKKLAEEQLRRAIRSRDDVLGVVAHDLRSPLNTIAMQASLLGEAGAEVPSGSRPPQEVIERAAKRMDDLIQDLLDVTRMEAERLSIDERRTSMAGLLSDAVEAHESQASSASLELRLDVARDLPDVWADRDRLLRVVENLVGNALKFTPKGGRITVGASRRDDEVLVWVADTGPGIAAEDVPHLFETFWQGRKADRRGAGLGLPIVKGIVEAHRGRVWVESEPGCGSTFFFAIPTGPRPEAAALVG